MLRPTLAALALAATPAVADYVRVDATGSVPEVMDRLEAAVTEAGATVFARVDHAEGATGVDMELPPSQLLIFGNPMLGTPAMQADLAAGLALPMKVLVMQEGEAVVILYEEVTAMFADFNVPADAEYVGKMEGALETLTSAAAAP